MTADGGEIVEDSVTLASTAGSCLAAGAIDSGSGRGLGTSGLGVSVVFSSDVVEPVSFLLPRPLEPTDLTAIAADPSFSRVLRSGFILLLRLVLVPRLCKDCWESLLFKTLYGTERPLEPLAFWSDALVGSALLAGSLAVGDLAGDGLLRRGLAFEFHVGERKSFCFFFGEPF